MHTTTRTLLVLALLAACGAQAADKAKEGSFGKGKPGGAYLTRDQLRNCLKQQARLSQLDGDNLKEQAALREAKAEIGRQADALKTQLATLDRTSAEAVNAYNAQAEARDKLIDDYQSRVAPFNTRVESVANERESFAQTCDNRRYFEEDEIAIRKGK